MAKYNNSNTVYSTDLGKICPGCQRSEANCSCSAKEKRARKNAGRETANPQGESASDPKDGIVRIRLEKKGRGGKSVTTVNGLPGDEKELKALAKKLKAKLGTGGAIKNGVVEFQGDHREDVQKHLATMGFEVKRVGN